MATTLDRPKTTWGVTCHCVDIEPSPSWSTLLSPQQRAVPSLSLAHVCAWPPAIQGEPPTAHAGLAALHTCAQTCCVCQVCPALQTWSTLPLHWSAPGVHGVMTQWFPEQL